MGYPFNVEFSASTEYGFVEWLAFNSSEHTLSAVTAMSEDELAARSLNGKGVDVSQAAETVTWAMLSTVTVNVNVPVTLVPWCDQRLRVTMTDPPLINTGVTYVRSKEIRIHFSAKLGYDNGDSIPFGEDLIQITGQNLDDSLPEWANPQESFDAPVYVYNAFNNYIRITPKSAEELLPPENALVFVTVGTGIDAENGYGLAAPVEFFYRTNADTITRAYKANNVWAIHDPADFADATAAEQFFYRGGARDADRRLRTTVGGKFQVTLYFYVTLSDPTIENPAPDMVKITELYFADLSGEEMGVMSKSAELDIALTAANNVGSGADTADGYYRDANVGESYLYKAAYTFAQEPTPDIIRLAVQPYRENLAPLAADDWETVISEGRFVAVVFDNAEPGGDNISLGLGGFRSEGVVSSNRVHYYDNDYAAITFAKNFSNAQDNYGLGLPLRRSSINKPWTA